MNKKAQISPFFMIIAIPIFMVLMLGVLVYTTYTIQAEDLKECKERCIKFGAEFEDFEPRGFSPEECWCNKNGEPLRVS